MDREYYAKRALEEKLKAEESGTDVASVHLAMAKLYEDRAALDVVPAPDSEPVVRSVAE